MLHKCHDWTTILTLSLGELSPAHIPIDHVLALQISWNHTDRGPSVHADTPGVFGGNAMTGIFPMEGAASSSDDTRSWGSLRSYDDALGAEILRGQ
jgi:hypothetical protein